MSGIRGKTPSVLPDTASSHHENDTRIEKMHFSECLLGRHWAVILESGWGLCIHFIGINDGGGITVHFDAVRLDPEHAVADAAQGTQIV